MSASAAPTDRPASTTRGGEVPPASAASSASRISPGLRAGILYLCFFASGAAGLIYEVVWSRYLALFIGSTGEAHIIILSTYMGGLALGGWLIGRHADRVRNPLMTYVALELGIGLFGLIYPQLFEPVRGAFIAMARGMGLGPAALNFAAVVVCMISLLPPTILMGGTLPVLGRYLVRSHDSIGRQISRLYYLNSMGAVVGSLLAGFWLVHTFGLMMSMVIAAALNFAVALLARILMELTKVGSDSPAQDDAVPGSAEPAPSEDAPATASIPPGVERIALIVIGISGLASMIYEVAWIRLLTLVLGSSTFSFALMLSAFIAGITLGSFLLSLKRTDHGYYGILGWCEIAIGLTSLVSIIFYEQLPVVINQWRLSLQPGEHTFALFQIFQFAFAFLVMFVPTVFMGATVPAASRVATDHVARIGRRVGGVFAINTLGTLIGSALAGFVLLPALGIRHTIEVAVALNVVLGLWVILTDRPRTGAARIAPKLAVSLCAAVPLLYLLIAPDWDIRVLNSGTYRNRWRIESLDQLKRIISKGEVLYARDGTDASVLVIDDHYPEGETIRSVKINGKADATTVDMVTQLLLGHLPMLIHPSPEDVLVVGLGCGVSAGATTLYDPRRVDCVELIPEMVEAARFFKAENQDVVDGGKVNIVIQDAKTFLQVTEHEYDVIINEPTNLWVTGVAGLYSREYFEVSRARMKPGALFVQWIQCYDILDSTFYSILQTFNEVFPHSTLFNFNAADVALVGCAEPFRPDLRLMEQRLADPRVAAALAPWGIHGPLPILSMQMVSKTESPLPYVRLGGINSDFFPVLELEAARGFFIGSKVEGPKSLDRRGRAPAAGGLWVADYEPSAPAGEEVFRAYAAAIDRESSLFGAQDAAWLDLWARYHPDSAEPDLRRALIERPDYAHRLALLESPDLAVSPEAMEIELHLLRKAYEQDRSWAGVPPTDDLIARLLRIRETPSLAPAADFLLGDIARDNGDPETALRHYGAALDAADRPDRPARDRILAADLRLRMADVHLSARDYEAALEITEQLERLVLSDPIAFELHRLHCANPLHPSNQR